MGAWNQNRLSHAVTLLSTPTDDILHPVMPIIQEILHAALNDDLSTADVAAFLSRLSTKQPDTCMADVSTIIVDLIWVIEIENEQGGSVSKEKLRLLTTAIIAQGFIPVDMMKERWEITFLELVGLIPNSKLFLKRLVRINTAQLYKQQKYNLLREESEGYSKLITELSSGTADDENDAETTLKADVVLMNVKSLIGYFDLDPNRVLDIMLDVFSANIVTHHRFFIEFLRRSPWNSKSREHSNTSTNRACAQILGFKFQNLQRPENRHRSSLEMYTVAALLIKHSIVQVEDLYPHLSLPDDEMDQEYKAFVADMKEKAMSFKNNALAMAGALLDEAAAGSTPGSDIKDEAMTDAKADAASELPIPNQKVGLTNALLSIGDLEHAMFILARFPRLTASHPETADLICRLIHIMIQDVYAPFSPKARHPELQKKKDCTYRYPVAIKGRETNVVRILSPRPPLPTSTERYEYFYADWKDDLVRCQNVQDLFEFVKALLTVVGVRIHRDISLVVKLCRIGAGTLKRLQEEITPLEFKIKLSKDTGDTSAMAEALDRLTKERKGVEEGWIEMCRALFLPTISLISANPGIVNEVWQVLKALRYETRFGLYGEWKTESAKLYPELLVTSAATEKEAKSVMRRINKEDVKQYGRMFAKYAHSNPLIVFAAATKQLEGGYDNMVQPLVDACKYLTAFGYDVLGYTLLESLSKKTRSKVQDDGTSAAKWMNTLASFCGNLYRKHTMAELDGILQYIVNQLRLGNAHDLVVLRELLAKMGGVEDTSNLNSSQLLAMAGGELLKNEALFGGVTGTVMKKNARSCHHLQNAMLHDNIANHLVVLIAQQRQQSIFADDGIPHLKLLSNMSDQAHGTLLQLLDFLSTNLQKEYPRLVPTLTDLCLKYKIEPSVAMYMIRPKLVELTRKELELQATAQSKSDDKMAVDSKGRDIARMDVDQDDTVKTAADSADEVWLPSLAPIAQEIQAILPPRAWRGMKPQFYVTFWQLTLYDIFVPVDQYNAEIDKLKRAVTVMDNDRTNYTLSMQAKRNRDRERLFQAAARLGMERDNQLANHQRIMDQLHREKHHWFQGLNRREIAKFVFQFCIYPRAIFSGLDALFCAKFIQLLHSIGTPNFGTLALYETLFLEADCIFFLSSESEAKTYGRFLCEVLMGLSRWHKDAAVYKKEGRGNDLPGIIMKWGQSDDDSKDTAGKFLDYDGFRALLYKWHTEVYWLFNSALESGEYMRIKNTIMILREIAICYPAMTAVGTRLIESTRSLAASEDRDDLKLLANAYLGVLKKYQDANLWMSVGEFYDKERFSNAAGPKEVVAEGVSNLSSKASNAKIEAVKPQGSKSDNNKMADERSIGRSNTAVSSSASTPAASQSARDRVPSARDIRGGGIGTAGTGSASSSGIGRRSFPLPPKPGTPVHEARHDTMPSSLNRDTRDQLKKERDVSSTNQLNAEGPPELLVISLKGGPAARSAQDGKEPAKDFKRESARDRSRDDVNDNGREGATKESARDTIKDYHRDSNGHRDAAKDVNTRDRARDYGEGSDRDLRGEAKNSSLVLTDNRDIVAARKELRDSAPRDPRDRDSREMVRLDSRDGRDNRDSRTGPGVGAGSGRDTREPRMDSRLPRGGREVRDSRDSRESRNLPAPADPRDIVRDEPRDMRYGGSRVSSQRESLNDTGRVSSSRNDGNHGDSNVASPSDMSYDREKDRQRDKDKYRDDDRKQHHGRESDRGREKDIVPESADRSGERDKRSQGRDRTRDIAKDSSPLEVSPTTTGRERQRPEGGSRELERRSSDRREALRDREDVIQGSRARDSPSRRGEERNREGRDRDVKDALPAADSLRDTESVGRSSATDRLDSREDIRDDGRGSSARTGTSSRDRDSRGSSRRQDIAQDAGARKSSKETQGRSERRTDSGDRKRGRESRNPSAERDRDSKRRRDSPVSERTRQESSRSSSSSRKRQVEPDENRELSTRDRPKDSSSTTGVTVPESSTAGGNITTFINTSVVIHIIFKENQAKSPHGFRQSVGIVLCKQFAKFWTTKGQ
ncbi:THO complex subunit 2 [Mortierella polycephala]|uniref:THO complex subunit 2 n=1 Tax=Mortierella polycephala TaxID=41804 RepID=A0A9P6QC38_9FUNG|nr:THO complex subunit 2 [Mortierella polycephala]